MQTTTKKTRLSPLVTAKTKITRPITRQTSKGINAQLDLQARARKIIKLFEHFKSEEPKQKEYKRCKQEFVDDLHRTQQDTFLVHGTKYYLKLVEEKIYNYSDEYAVKQIELDKLKKELKALKEHEIDCGIAKYEGSKLSLRPTINTEAI